MDTGLEKGVRCDLNLHLIPKRWQSRRILYISILFMVNSNT
jgi:hypothetical protein